MDSTEFPYNNNDLVLTVPEPVDNTAAATDSNFDETLKYRWKAASESGVCRYQLKLQTKILPGKFGFVAQLNPDRATLRRKPQDLQKVNVPFDPDQFNFNAVPPKEILMKIGRITDGPVSDNVLVINISPLEFGNCLLVPNLSQNIRQKITLQGLELMINVMLLSTDPGMRSGFNSPGAYSSVNHQHFHLYYLQERLYIEKANVKQICGPCYALTEYPAQGFAFQLEKDPAQLAKDVFTLTSYLRKNEIAHNMFCTRGKRFTNPTEDRYDTLRIFVWARAPVFGVKPEICLNPALCELGGHQLIKVPSDYDNVDEAAIATLFREITTPWFEQVAAKIPQLYCSNGD